MLFCLKSKPHPCDRPFFYFLYLSESCSPLFNCYNKNSRRLDSPITRFVYRAAGCLAPALSFVGTCGTAAMCFSFIPLDSSPPCSNILQFSLSLFCSFPRCSYIIMAPLRAVGALSLFAACCHAVTINSDYFPWPLKAAAVPEVHNGDTLNVTWNSTQTQAILYHWCGGTLSTASSSSQT